MFFISIFLHCVCIRKRKTTTTTTTKKNHLIAIVFISVQSNVYTLVGVSLSISKMCEGVAMHIYSSLSPLFDLVD